MIEIFIYFLSALVAIGIVSRAGDLGYLNGAFQRGFAGAGAQIVSAKWLYSYTNLESFLRASYNGYLGLPGYIFLASLIFLLIIWVNNLIEYRQAII